MIIVTGGAGFIGRHLVKRLETEGEGVFVLDDYSRADRDYGECRYDVCLPEQVELAFEAAESFEQVNEVIHLAYINGTRHFYERPYEVMEVALRGMLNVIQACKNYNVKKFTLVSSSEVCRFKTVNADESVPLIIPDPYNARYSYSAGKIMSEKMALHCGLFDHLTIVRPFNIYGPGMSEGHVIPDLIKKIRSTTKAGEEIEIIGSGEETRSFCYIDDFIDGLMIARKKGEHRGIYNVGTPQETSIRHLIDMLQSIMGYSVVISEKNQWREGDLLRRRPDISKLEELGYEPKWTLWNGLKEVINEGSARERHA